MQREVVVVCAPDARGADSVLTVAVGAGSGGVRLHAAPASTTLATTKLSVDCAMRWRGRDVIAADSRTLPTGSHAGLCESGRGRGPLRVSAGELEGRALEGKKSTASQLGGASLDAVPPSS